MALHIQLISASPACDLPKAARHIGLVLTVHRLGSRYVKAAATLLLLLGLLTAAANVWCVGSLNRKYIPQACAQAEVLLERKVCLPSEMPDASFCTLWMPAQRA